MSRAQGRDEPLEEPPDTSGTSDLGGDKDEAGEDKDEPIENRVEGTANLIGNGGALDELEFGRGRGGGRGVVSGPVRIGGGWGRRVRGGSSGRGNSGLNPGVHSSNVAVTRRGRRIVNDELESEWKWKRRVDSRYHINDTASHDQQQTDDRQRPDDVEPDEEDGRARFGARCSLFGFLLKVEREEGIGWGVVGLIVGGVEKEILEVDHGWEGRGGKRRGREGDRRLRGSGKTERGRWWMLGC
jgi:hypothetical protein